MSIFKTLGYILFGYLIYKIFNRFISAFGTKKDYGYTSETPRQEGDVVIEKRAPNKSKKKVTDDTEYVDFEEVD